MTPFEEFILILNRYNMYISFFSHSLIFIGTFYVAMFNIKLPQWHLTPLWYLGLMSAVVVFTILTQTFVGVEHPMSYWNFGQFAESLSNISLAFIALIMLISTYIRKRKSKK